MEDTEWGGGGIGGGCHTNHHHYHKNPVPVFPPLSCPSIYFSAYCPSHQTAERLMLERMHTVGSPAIAVYYSHRTALGLLSVF